MTKQQARQALIALVPDFEQHDEALKDLCILSLMVGFDMGIEHSLKSIRPALPDAIQTALKIVKP